MVIRLVALDLDGTVLNSQGEISQNTVKAIDSLIRKGIKIVICTGRPAYSLRPILTRLNLVDDETLLVSFNGALVSYPYQQEIIFEEFFSPLEIADLISICTENDIPYHLQTNDGMYTLTKEIHPATFYDSQLNETEVKKCTLADLKKINVYKLMLVGTTAELSDNVKRLPATVFADYQGMRSLACFFDILPKRANKGQGLKRAADKLRIPASDILAIGDNENDLSMFEFAGQSVAMGNAATNIQEAADFITSGNDAEGVVTALKHFNLI
nr:Cof-type HAD-IIB family hydrolase [Vagococcus allomyrinae]